MYINKDKLVDASEEFSIEHFDEVNFSDTMVERLKITHLATDGSYTLYNWGEGFWDFATINGVNYVIEYATKKIYINPSITKEDLIKEFKRLSKNRFSEDSHESADELLLEFINDAEIRAAYEKIDRSYSTEVDCNACGRNDE